MSTAKAAFEYTLLNKWTVSNCPVNALLFSRDGSCILTGGDDEVVRVFDVASGESLQTVTVASSKWGQITDLVWTTNEHGVSYLCIGTGRGALGLARITKGPCHLGNISTSYIFDFNDPVESLAFDEINHRVAASSQGGEIYILGFRDPGTLKAHLKVLFEIKDFNSIPRGLHFFGDSNNMLLFHGLTTGEQCCYSLTTGEAPQRLWSRQLRGGCGASALSSDNTMILISNLMTLELDLYRAGETAPFRTFYTGTRRRKTFHCCFAEAREQVVVVGSDHGTLYIFNTRTGGCIQKLVHDTDKTLIMPVAAFNKDEERYLLASGSATSIGTVCIWKKARLAAAAESSIQDSPRIPLEEPVNARHGIPVYYLLWIGVFQLLISAPLWLPYIIPAWNIFRVRVLPSSAPEPSATISISMPASSVSISAPVPAAPEYSQTDDLLPLAVPIFDHIREDF